MIRNHKIRHYIILILTITSITLEKEQIKKYKKMNEKCKGNSECSPPYLNCIKRKCQHKRLFPLELKETIGIIFFLIISILASAAGIGGGGLLIPLLLFFFEFEQKRAVALSNGLVFFIGLTKTLIGLTKTHPLISGKTMIDYNIILIFISSMLLGSFLGSLFSQIIPNSIQILFLLIIILFAALTTFVKTIRLYDNEKSRFVNARLKKSEISNESKEKPNSLDSENESSKEEVKINKSPDKKKIRVKHLLIREFSTISNKEKKKNKKIDKKFIIPLTEKELKLQDDVRRNESKNCNPKKMIMIFLTTLTSLIIIILRGGKQMGSLIGTEKCGILDFTLITLYVSLTAVFCAINYAIIQSEEDYKILAKWKEEKGEKKYSEDFICKSNIYGIFIGFISAIAGIGGGMILNPFLMSSVDLNPQVTSFTGMYIITLNKLISLIVFIYNGNIDLDYLLLLGILGALFVLIGEVFLGGYVRKNKKQSLISFIFSFLMLGAFLLVGFIACKQFIQKEGVQADGKGFYEFGNFCE